MRSDRIPSPPPPLPPILRPGGHLPIGSGHYSLKHLLIPSNNSQFPSPSRPFPLPLARRDEIISTPRYCSPPPAVHPLKFIYSQRCKRSNNRSCEFRFTHYQRLFQQHPPTSARKPPAPRRRALYEPILAVETTIGWCRTKRYPKNSQVAINTKWRRAHSIQNSFSTFARAGPQ